MLVSSKPVSYIVHQKKVDFSFITCSKNIVFPVTLNLSMKSQRTVKDPNYVTAGRIVFKSSSALHCRFSLRRFFYGNPLFAQPFLPVSPIATPLSKSLSGGHRSVRQGYRSRHRRHLTGKKQIFRFLTVGTLFSFSWVEVGDSCTGWVINSSLQQVLKHLQRFSSSLSQCFVMVQ